MKNQSAFEQVKENEVTLKSWTVPVVEVHDIDQLTRQGITGSNGDGGTGGNSYS